MYEVCAALGKLEHLTFLLSKREGPPREHRVDSWPLEESIIVQNATFYFDLMGEAVVNSRLDIIDFLAPYYKDSQALVKRRLSKNSLFNGSFPAYVVDADGDQVLLRLAIGNGSVAIFNKLIELAGDRLKLHDFNNKLLGLALEYGHLELVNRFLEFKEVRDTVLSDWERLLFCAIRGGSLPVLNRYLDLVDIAEVVREFGSELLSFAITTSSVTSPLEIVDRILSFKEIRKAINERANGLLSDALKRGSIEIIDRLLA